MAPEHRYYLGERFEIGFVCRPGIDAVLRVAATWFGGYHL